MITDHYKKKKKNLVIQSHFEWDEQNWYENFDFKNRVNLQKNKILWEKIWKILNKIFRT